MKATDLTDFAGYLTRYGWVPDLPDFRDLLYKEAVDKFDATKLPAEVDLTPNMPSIWDQLALGSCTAHGVLACFMYHHPELPELSRLFQYFNSRALEGTTREDAGATVRDAIKAANQFGEAPESEWPYLIDQFATKPHAELYTEGQQEKALKYHRVSMGRVGSTEYKLRYLMHALANDLPVTFGFSVYASFESNEVAQSGVVPLPNRSEEFLGGHCVVAVGYGQQPGYIKCRNSWGEGWGDHGYFYMPYEYLINRGLASDFWAIDKIGAPA